MRIFTKQSEKSDREISAQVQVSSYDCSPPVVYKPHILNMSQCMRFPTMWHFDMCRLG